MAEKGGFWSKLFSGKRSEAPKISDQNQNPENKNVDENSPKLKEMTLIDFNEPQKDEPKEPMDNKDKEKNDFTDNQEVVTDIEQEKVMEHAAKIAESLIDNLWESEYLKPTDEKKLLSKKDKYDSLDDYLRKELFVDVDKELYKDPNNANKIDTIIRYKWEDRLLSQAKRFGIKTLTSAGSMFAVGGVMSIFTGGTSLAATGAAFAGSTGSRAIIESMRAYQGIWGKEKTMNVALAKDYVFYALEAQKMAKEFKALELKIEEAKRHGSLEPPELMAQRLQSAEKLINLIYDNEKKPLNTRLQEIVKKKEELAGYQKKWNTAEEIVSFVGGVGTSAAYSLTKGVETLATQKLSAVTAGKMEINFDGKGISHAVQKIGDGWHFVIKDIDMQTAIQKVGETNLGQFYHQITSEGIKKTAEVGTTHAYTISEQAIQNYLHSEAMKEFLQKAIPVSIAADFAGGTASYFTEKQMIYKQMGLPSDEEIASKEILKDKYNTILTTEIKRWQEKEKNYEAEINPAFGPQKEETNKKEAEAETIEEKNVSKEKARAEEAKKVEVEKKEIPGLLGKLNVGDVFIYDDTDGYGNMIRYKVIAKDDKEMKVELVDKEVSGREYPEKYHVRKIYFDDPEVIDSANERIIFWNDKRDYAFYEWQNISKYLDENQERINILAENADIVFKESKYLENIGVDLNKKYKIRSVSKDTNKVFIYEDKPDNKENIELRLDKVLPIILTATPFVGQPKNMVNKEKESNDAKSKGLGDINPEQVKIPKDVADQGPEAIRQWLEIKRKIAERG